MASYLKQSTAVEIALGPFVDAADGVTPETSLTISQGDVRLKKNGAAWAQKNESSSANHEENGWYEVALDSTDTNTLGILMVAVYESGALPAWREFQVVTSSVFDLVVNGVDVDTYQAKVWMFDDDNNTADRYVVCFFKNGQPITSGITSPTIQVIKASDGSDLVASTALTQVASLGLYRKDEASNRIVDGAAYFAKVQATIDSSTRTWYQPIGRDS